MQVISDAKELEKHTYIKTRNPNIFPKKERLGLAQRMMNEASDLVADLMEANDLLLTDPQERELRYRAQLPEADPPHRARPRDPQRARRRRLCTLVADGGRRQKPDRQMVQIR